MFDNDLLDWELPSYENHPGFYWPRVLLRAFYVFLIGHVVAALVVLILLEGRIDAGVSSYFSLPAKLAPSLFSAGRMGLQAEGAGGMALAVGLYAIPALLIALLVERVRAKRPE